MSVYDRVTLITGFVLIAGAAIAVPALAEPLAGATPAVSAGPPASPAAVSPDGAPESARVALCAAPAGLVQLGLALRRVARRLAADRPIKIVAIGSSSTAGAMASSPAASYPSRLAVDLQHRFPTEDITVLNRGVNGEEAADMLTRLDADVIAEKPDLVLWQVGTNAVLRDHPLERTAELIHQGIVRLKASGADVVLIDPQYSPRVIAKSEAQPMVELIAAAAKRDNVALFRRFAVMRYWRDHDHMRFDTFVAPDGLHMNDWSYGCWAKLLGGAIAKAASSVTAVAGAVQEIKARQ